MLCHPGTSHNDDIGAVFVSKRLPNRRHAGEGIGTSFDLAYAVGGERDSTR